MKTKMKTRRCKKVGEVEAFKVGQKYTLSMEELKSGLTEWWMHIRFSICKIAARAIGLTGKSAVLKFYPENHYTGVLISFKKIDGCIRKYSPTGVDSPSGTILWDTAKYIDDHLNAPNWTSGVRKFRVVVVNY
jgi:hypothetical protein